MPLRAVVLAQSPYNRDIFPLTASAMSYEQLLTLGSYQEMPATVEVLSNDISRVCNIDFTGVADWLRDSWMYIETGVLVINCRSVTLEGSPESDRESARLLRMLKTMIEASTSSGAGATDVYTLGNSAKDIGDKVRSSVDTTACSVTVRSAPHPAYIARQNSDLRSPECTLGRLSFSRKLGALIMNTKRAQEVIREKERELLAKDLNSLSVHGRKVASSYSEYVSILEKDPDTETVPKAVALQMLTTLSESIISMCEASRNVATFVKLATPVAGGSDMSSLTSSVTREPLTSSRLHPGEVRTLPLPPPATSAPSAGARKMSAAELRRLRTGATAVPETPVTPATAMASPGAPSTPTRTASMAAPSAPPSVGTPSVTASAAAGTPQRPVSARVAKMLAKKGATAPPAQGVTEAEARSMAVMAEYISNNRDDVDGAAAAEQLMSSAASRSVTDDVTRVAVAAVRADAARDASYDAGAYLGLGDATSNATSDTYQFCQRYPAFVPRP